MAIVNIDNGEPTYLTPFSYNVIGFPYLFHDTLYFSYSYRKNDELFAYTFADKKLWKIKYDQEKGIGKYQPSVNTKKIIWSAFTAEGYQLTEVSKADVQFEEMKGDSLDKNTSCFGIASLKKPIPIYYITFRAIRFRFQNILKDSGSLIFTVLSQTLTIRTTL